MNFAKHYLSILISLFSILLICQTTKVILPTICEAFSATVLFYMIPGYIQPVTVCKYMTLELQNKLAETEKSKAVLETGHGFDKKKKIQYQYSELRLTEALHEPHVCDRLLKYNIHHEKQGSLRYAKGRSETMQTLHGLRMKGVKVDLGIPEDLWDTPSVEVSDLHRKCIRLVEDHESDIEDWYFKHQADKQLQEYLCKEIVLLSKESDCLSEKESDTNINNADTKKLKGEITGGTKVEL